VHVKLVPLLGDDACGILTPVLQQQQSVINQLVNGGFADDTDYAAHGVPIMMCCFLKVNPIVKLIVSATRPRAAR
jgi:hypothetical protein